MNIKMWKYILILFAAVVLLGSCCGNCSEHRAGGVEAVREVVSEETWERYVDEYVVPVTCEIMP